MNEATSFKLLKTITMFELEKRTFKGLPNCLKISSSKYLVGRCKLTKIGTNWQVIDYSSTVIFGNFSSAMYYCVCVQTHNEQDAKNIAQLDNQVRLLANDNETFKIRLTNASKTQDGWKYDLYAARYEQTKAQLASVSGELTKKLNLAKHYKLKDFKW